MIGTRLAFLGFGRLALLAILEFASERMDRVFCPNGLPALRARLSALVIGAWLLGVGPLQLYQGLFGVLTLYFPLPLPPFGFELPARGDAVYLVLMAAAAVAIGFGLLKGNCWARWGAIAFCIFAIASDLATELRPEVAACTVEAMQRNIHMPHAHIALWPEGLWAVVPPVLTIYLLAAWKIIVRGGSEDRQATGL